MPIVCYHLDSFLGNLAVHPRTEGSSCEEKHENFPVGHFDFVYVGCGLGR